MALALYRKYRPAKFAEVVGQEHVTDPLRTALESGRINHAYLFSGPRGCGKTSSARILARSLNCEQGPTPEPCGVCSSCVSLAPGGPGNIDVTELDAASHGGVDDTRELRDRAFFAPAESRYRVFIVDEAHMITTQGFNALLKIVEEPPEHLVFVFATTEPEKVLPTIRSRTHHYPFRLIPPGTLRKLLERICAEEGVAVAAAVYPLVIRAGGGSARDSLSVLDQLVSGAGPEGVTYERAVALLGVTDVSLIDDVVDALAAGDRAAVFEAVDRLVEAGHDPRRFATDLLQRLRDLTLLQAVPEAVGRGIVEAADDEVSRMVEQSGKFGPATLTRYGEILHTGLTEMRGATAPRLLLELLCARMLLPAATTAEPGLLERLERLERRSAIAAGPPAPGEAGDDAEHGRQFDRPSTRPVDRGAAGTGAAVEPRTEAGGGHARSADQPTGPRSGPPANAEHGGLIVVTRGGGPGTGAEHSERVAAAPERGSGSAAEHSGRDAEAAGRGGATGESAARSPQTGTRGSGGTGSVEPQPQAPAAAVGANAGGDTAGERPDRSAAADLGAADVRRVWQEIQDAVKQRKKRTAALLVSATVRAVEHDTLVLSIGTAPLARLLSEQSNTDVIAEALHAVLGVRWRVRCEHGDGPAPVARGATEQRTAPTPPASGRPADEGRSAEPAGAAPVGGQGSGGAPRPEADVAAGSGGSPGSFAGPAPAPGAGRPGSGETAVGTGGGGATSGVSAGQAGAAPASAAGASGSAGGGAGSGSAPARLAGGGPVSGDAAVASAGVGPTSDSPAVWSADAGLASGHPAVWSADAGLASGHPAVGSADAAAMSGGSALRSTDAEPASGGVAAGYADAGPVSGGAAAGSADARLTPGGAAAGSADAGLTSGGAAAGRAGAGGPAGESGPIESRSGGAGPGGTAITGPAAAPGQPGAVGRPSAPTSGGAALAGGSPGTSSIGSAPSSQSLSGQTPSGGVASGGAAARAKVSGMAVSGRGPAGGVAAGRSTGTSGRPQFERRSIRAGGRATVADEGVPLPPEPPDEDVPPDDEEAMLAEIDADVDGQQAPAVSDPEAAAIALLTTQLGARAINPR